MKLGLAIKIDVSKIDKARLYKGAKGTYLDLKTFVDTENVGQFGDNGIVSQEKNKDEDVQMPILGNVKIFWKDDSQQDKQNQETNDDIDCIPF